MSGSDTRNLKTSPLSGPSTTMCFTRHWLMLEFLCPQTRCRPMSSVSLTLSLRMESQRSQTSSSPAKRPRVFEFPLQLGVCRELWKTGNECLFHHSQSSCLNLIDQNRSIVSSSRISTTMLWISALLVSIVQAVVLFPDDVRLSNFQGALSVETSAGVAGIQADAVGIEKTAVDCNSVLPTLVRDSGNLFLCRNSYLQSIDSRIGVITPQPTPTTTVPLANLPLNRGSLPSMCRELPIQPSGWYWIWPKGWDGPIPVFCDFDTKFDVLNPVSKTLQGLTTVWWGCEADGFGRLDPLASVYYPARVNAATFQSSAGSGLKLPSIWVGLPLFRQLSNNAQYIAFADMSTQDAGGYPQNFLINDVASETARFDAIYQTAHYGTPNFDPSAESDYFKAVGEVNTNSQYESTCGPVSTQDKLPNSAFFKHQFFTHSLSLSLLFHTQPHGTPAGRMVFASLRTWVSVSPFVPCNPLNLTCLFSTGRMWTQVRRRNWS